MKISLIGMSNSGKTYWSNKLEKIGFKRYSCDEMIEKRLEEEYKNNSFSGINDIAKWMGQPYEKGYPQSARKYLEFERESLLTILDQLEKNSWEDYVVDTTGSVIYLGEKIMRDLAKHTKVVLLDIPLSIREEMYKNYFNHPKPVYWGNSFHVLNGESPKEALRRCYPLLLDYRTKQYRRYADVIVDSDLLRSASYTIEDLLNLV